MIQRIQTIFILVATFLTGLIFILPIAEISANGQVYVFKSLGVLQGDDIIFSGLPVVIFLGIILVLHLAALFMYKKRIKQIRILVFTILLLLGLFGIFYYFTYACFENETVAFQVTVAFPLAAMILDFLAIRAIGKDEALVRSLDRIR